MSDGIWNDGVDSIIGVAAAGAEVAARSAGVWSGEKSGGLTGGGGTAS